MLGHIYHVLRLHGSWSFVAWYPRMSAQGVGTGILDFLDFPVSGFRVLDSDYEQRVYRTSSANPGF